jgi:hypothetical protein
MLKYPYSALSNRSNGEVNMGGIYVETLIKAPLEKIWQVTQDPATHCRWDVRFGRIDAVPGSTPARFRYATTVLPGVEIGGHGTHAGERHRADGTRTSVLRFGSDDRRSLIAAGHGYWRYVPEPGGVRFLTGYTYQARWGASGWLVDLTFRPLFGWATAWSFDRLRLWLERGVPPERALRNAWCQVAVRAGVVALVAALGLGGLVTAAAAVLLLLVPPGPDTPAARRCRRRPSRPADRLAARTPSLLETL